MSLKIKLILSHTLPILILVPFLGFYLLSNLRNFYFERLNDDLSRSAVIVAETLHTDPDLASDPSRLQKLVDSISSQVNARIEIIGRDGTILASARSKSVTQIGTVSNDPAVRAALQGQVSKETGQDDVAVVAVPILSERVGAVRLSLSLSDVETVFNRLDMLIVAGVLALTLLSLVIGYALGLTLSSPLRQLSRDVKAIAQGDYSRHVITGGDAEVTELAANFNEMVDRLAEQRVARERLLSDVVHELRRPISAIQTAVEVVREASNGNVESRKHLLNGVGREMDRLGRLTNRLVFAARDGDAPLLTKRVSVDFVAVVNRVIVLFEPEAQRLDIKLISELPATLPLIKGDEDALFEILTNLIDNALKFTPTGGQVRVSAGATQDQVWVEVADTGMGLTDEEQRNLFRRYYRGDQTRTRPRGIGLGLAIAYELTQAHSGTIRVCSQPAQGATFRVEIPR